MRSIWNDEEDEHDGARRTGRRARRYAVGTRVEKTRILDEFEAVTAFRRKHAMRVLRSGATRRRAEGRAGRRIYDDAVRDALVVLWEASDRICGKRLKALMPTLVEAMERHGHLKLGPEIRAGLFAMSAATIDRALRAVREGVGDRRRRRTAPPSSVRRSIPVRTFSDWDDPPPGFAEADLVAHSGPVTRGSFVQMLVVTDIATGWTECAPVLYREQTLLREVLGEVRRLMPFELLGFDTDSDSVFINETLRDYCRDAGIVFTRCRPWRKNDQTFVEQKNGAVVRRIVGYRRLEGIEVAAALSRLYATTRLYVNLFQPSFKLASKRRDGARVSKRYHAPATPGQRLLADPRTPAAVGERVAELARTLDPIRLLRQIRAHQQGVVELADQPATEPEDTAVPPLEQFLAGLRTAWAEGEVRPTARPPTKPKHERRRPDPLVKVTEQLHAGSRPSRGVPAASCWSGFSRPIRTSTRTVSCAPCSGGSKAGAGRRRLRWCSASCQSRSTSRRRNRTVEPRSPGTSLHVGKPSTVKAAGRSGGIFVTACRPAAEHRPPVTRP